MAFTNYLPIGPVFLMISQSYLVFSGNLVQSYIVSKELSILEVRITPVKMVDSTQQYNTYMAHDFLTA